MLSLLPAIGLVLPLVPGTPSEVRAVVAANNQLACNLYHQLKGQGGNLFFSPYSVHKTLAMAYAGARGDTAREMAAALHLTLDPDRQHRAFLETRQLLNRPHPGGTPAFVTPFRPSPDVQLFLSADLWGQRGAGFEERFRALLKECYGAGLYEADFGTPERARQAINARVAEQTHQQIRELFPADTINLNTRLVLASAIYFKGAWLHSFAKEQTRRAPFRSGAGGQILVPTMSQRERFEYFEDARLQGVRLPYAGKDLAMLVLLPKSPDGLDDLEKGLTSDQLAAWVGRLHAQPVEVYLPRFELAGAFALDSALRALGMRKAFTPGEADFRSMDGGRESLHISAVKHQGSVVVNEEGTEAAAATGVVMDSLSAPAAGTVFRADHPFVFLIEDVQTGMILFLGRLVRP